MNEESKLRISFSNMSSDKNIRFHYFDLRDIHNNNGISLNSPIQIFPFFYQEEIRTENDEEKINLYDKQIFLFHEDYKDELYYIIYYFIYHNFIINQGVVSDDIKEKYDYGRDLYKEIYDIFSSFFTDPGFQYLEKVVDYYIN